MKEQLIHAIPIFAELPSGEIEQLAQNLRPRVVSEGTVLMKEDESGEDLFIILDGEVEIIKALGTGDERLLAVREASTFLGEMSFFSEDGRHTASVRAKTALQVLEMSRSDFNGLLNRHPPMAYGLVRTLSQRLDESEDLTIEDLRRKNRELLRAYKELEAAQEQIIEKERMEQELEVARDIQMSILPRDLPDIPCFGFGSLIEPMAAVGGDFFDVIPLGDEKLGIVAGDVSDHGVPAALFMAMTVTLIRAASRRIDSPIEVLQSVNRNLLEMNDHGMFVTILYGIMDCATREFEYARAGHTLPMMVDSQGDLVDMAHDSGQLLGLFTDPLIDVQRISLEEGNLLIVFTDGVAEAMNADGVMFGTERLHKTLSGSMKESAQNICGAVWASLDEFRGEIAQHDDVTLLVIKVE
jgi:serine phosphatase RsbU (regulator of sigma subunit)